MILLMLKYNPMEPTQELQQLQQTLDDIRHEDENGEYWYARELYPLLGYKKWENFENAMRRAKESCERANSSVADHFPGVRKMINLAKGASREIEDFKLTRYACYLIAINGDTTKQEIAFAQAYFVIQTRKMEVLQEKVEEIERLDLREKNVLTEKEFQKTLYEHGVDGHGIARVRNAGDGVLFGGHGTKTMKKKFGITAKNKPLADVLPPVTLKAKDLASAITTESTKLKNLQGEMPITKEHKTNNQNVRKALTSADIYPENLSPAEGIKKIASKHKKDIKKLSKKQS